MKRIFNNHSLGLILLFLLLIPSITAAQTSAQFVLYLEGEKNIDRHISFDIDSVFLIGVAHTIRCQPSVTHLATESIDNKQLLLIEQPVYPGIYQELVIFYSNIKALAGTAPIYPNPDSNGIRIPLNTDILPETAYSHFIYWSPSETEYHDRLYRPNFVPIKKELPPRGAAVYVANRGSGNISVIDRFSRRVVDVIKSGSQPLDMAVSSLRQILYVIHGDTPILSVINTQLSTVEKIIRLQYGDDPIRVDITPEDDALYLLYAGARSLTRLNPISMQEETRFEVGFDPTAFTFDSYSQTLYVGSGVNNELVKINRYASSQAAVLAINSPVVDLTINNRENLIYTAPANSGLLTILNAATGGVKHSVKICAPSNSIVYDPLTETLFAAVADCEEISIIKPQDGLEIGNIRLSSRPGRIVLDSQTRNLLVTLPEEQAVAWVNVNTKKIEQKVPVGKEPIAITVTR